MPDIAVASEGKGSNPLPSNQGEAEAFKVSLR